MKNVLVLLSILLLVFFLHQRYINKIENMQNSSDYYNYNDIQKYLLDNIYSIEKERKPILWILIKYQYNSRNWQSFGSRSSTDLNQPYIHLTVKSIIKHCDKSFRICLIDEDSFHKLLPDWNVDMSKISYPISMYMTDLAMTKILYRYGGMRVPMSFLCTQDLIKMYNVGTSHNTVFMCEKVNRNITSTGIEFYPTMEFMGAKKNNKVIKELINFMETTISHDFTSENHSLGDFDRWCEMKSNDNSIKIIDGKFIGTKTVEDKPVLIDNLLSSSHIDIYHNTYGIYIPSCELMNRTNYNWFLRMSEKQIRESKMMISKYITHGIIENMKQERDWVGFWKVPSGAPLWGMKPLNAGPDDYVQRLEYPYN
jgi:hypothetical protein